MGNEKQRKENFFKKAFREMGENAKEQHKVDKANFKAVKAESKANFEENRGKNTFKRAKENAKEYWNYAKLSNKEKRELKQKELEKELEDANVRILKAESRIEKAKQERK